jgi:ribosome biogenesis GTPase
LQGTLLKGYSGFYYVYAAGKVWECSLRGRLRLGKQDFLPGDLVEIMPAVKAAENLPDRACVESVLPRRSVLQRPPVANVDLVFLIFASVNPKPDADLLSRLVIQTNHAGLETVILFSKTDQLAGTKMSPDLVAAFQKTCDVISYSAVTGAGLAEVRARLQGRVTVLAGPSGVGKSSLLNALEQELRLKTGEISVKTKRGKHSTRHVELLRVAGGLVADTPGFSSYDLPDIKPEELERYFPELEGMAMQCRFRGCRHDQEPDCRVKAAAANGEIHPLRYEYYLRFLKELRERPRDYRSSG